MAHPLSPPLFPEDAPPRPPAPSPVRVHTVPERLWMAVHFPRLALEALGIPPADPAAIALVAGAGRNTRVVDCSAGAAGRGVQPGQTLPAALVLAPGLRVIERDCTREHAALLKLAEASQGYTPTVSLEPPTSLLLEVAGSAHLFGGAAAIGSHARERFRQGHYTAATALAPTPLAALWLAQALQDVAITEREALRSVLGKLPVRALAWDPAVLDAFGRLGIRRLVDIFRLPREGLIRRFGAEFLAVLDRATGQLSDPRAGWQAPGRIRLARELPGEFDSMPALLPYTELMLEELCRELRIRDAAVERVRLSLRHWRQAPTAVTVGSARPHRDAARWRTLVQNHLAGLALTAPVHTLVLLSDRLKPHAAETQDLPGTRRDAEDSAGELTELLRARLGRRAVFGLDATPDARPERAWREVEPGEQARDPRLPPPRPLGLLPAPLPLASVGGRPSHRGGTLALLQGPERIEGGWWDGEVWRRDYYQALSGRGERLWVFRERRRWFLHGWFA